MRPVGSLTRIGQTQTPREVTMQILIDPRGNGRCIYDETISLAALGRMKRLFEEENLVGGRNLVNQAVRISAERARDKYDVYVRIERTNLFCRLDTINSGWHANVQEHDGEWLVPLHRGLNSFNRGFALVS